MAQPAEVPSQLTAAERVFGITELCEQILSDDGLPSRKLFAFRYVSRTFSNTIVNSNILRQKMKPILPATSAKNGMLAAFPNFHHLKEQGRLQFRPFTFHGVFLGFESSFNRQKPLNFRNPIFQFSLFTDMISYTSTVGSRPGYMSQRQAYPSSASWAELGLSNLGNVAVYIWVDVHVVVENECQGMYKLKERAGVDQLALRDLFEVLERVMGRSPEEHLRTLERQENKSLEERNLSDYKPFPAGVGRKITARGTSRT